MVNGSFVFGMDDDDATVFDRTVEWAIAQGIETATFHILTPYPGTRLNRRLTAEGRIVSTDWELLRHAPRRLPPRADDRRSNSRPATGAPTATSTAGVRSAAPPGRTTSVGAKARHALYTAGWKKLEPVWDVAIRHGRVHRMLPLLESVLAVKRGSGQPPSATSGADRPAAPAREAA